MERDSSYPPFQDAAADDEAALRPPALPRGWLRAALGEAAPLAVRDAVFSAVDQVLAGGGAAVSTLSGVYAKRRAADAACGEVAIGSAPPPVHVLGAGGCLGAEPPSVPPPAASAAGSAGRGNELGVVPAAAPRVCLQSGALESVAGVMPSARSFTPAVPSRLPLRGGAGGRWLPMRLLAVAAAVALGVAAGRAGHWLAAGGGRAALLGGTSSEVPVMPLVEPVGSPPLVAPAAVLIQGESFGALVAPARVDPDCEPSSLGGGRSRPPSDVRRRLRVPCAMGARPLRAGRRRSLEARFSGASRPHRAGGVEAASGSDDWLGEQLAILARAERGLLEGDVAAALSAFEEYSERFPRGLLDPQMAAVRRRLDDRQGVPIFP